MIPYLVGPKSALCVDIKNSATKPIHGGASQKITAAISITVISPTFAATVMRDLLCRSASTPAAGINRINGSAKMMPPNPLNIDACSAPMVRIRKNVTNNLKMLSFNAP